MDAPDASTNVPQGSRRTGTAIPVTEQGTSLLLEEYNFKHERRGKCIIINNRTFDPETRQSERDGTDFDAERIEQVFCRLGFDVERHNDIKTINIRILMRKISQEDHSNADCFACVMLSHGKEGQIFGTDGIMSIDSITSMFKGDVCQSLAGKPKLFFIQACRGTKFDHGVEVEDEVDGPPSSHMIRKIPAEADFLMAYSVVPGLFSWRNNVDGSWFIQAIYQVFQEHGQAMDLLQMMTLVNKIVAYDFASCTDHEWTDNMKQVPSIVSMLTRQIYFHPKY